MVRLKRLKRLKQWLQILAGLTLGLVCIPASAANFATLQLDGALLSAGGGPVVDGDYGLTFSIEASDKVGDPSLWAEGPVILTVKSGQFHYALGSKVALTPQLLAPAGQFADRWLTVQVGNDPPLAPVALRAVPAALVAQAANSLQCSGCITAANLDPAALKDFAKTTDLSAYAKSSDLQAYVKAAELAAVAKSGSYLDLKDTPDLSAFAQKAGLATVATTGAYADLAGKPTLANVAISGNYSDLNGKPAQAKLGTACGSNLVVNGLAADGSLQCVAAMDPKALPADGLAQVSNGLLTDQFTDVVNGSGVIAIKDYYPPGVADIINFPDIGVAQAFSVDVDISNSDLSKLTVTLTDPNNVNYVLFNGATPGASLKASYPKTATVSGDLSTWLGKNPKGKWYLTVIDNSFVAPGAQFDGAINSWSISLQTLSNKKVASTGIFVAQGGFKYPVAPSDPVVCDGSMAGYAYLNSKVNVLYICNGTAFFPIALTPSGTVGNPGTSCKDIQSKNPVAADGVYWINPGGSSFQVFCDMTTAGGGWTLVMTVHPQDGSVVSFTNTTFWQSDKEYGSIANKFSNDYKSPASYLITGAAVMVQVAGAGDAGAITGWKAWNMVPKPFDTFFDAAANTTQTVSVIGSDVSKVYPYEPLIKNGNQLQSNRLLNPNNDRVRLGVDGYSAQGDDNQPGLGTQMNESICGVGVNCYRYRDVELWVNSNSNLWCTPPGDGSYGWIGTDGGCGSNCGPCEGTKSPPYTPYWTYRMYVR